MSEMTLDVDNQTADCILLFGMPRSGTTWLGKLFDSHPETLYRHEPDTSKRLVISRYPPFEDAHQYTEAIQNFVAGLRGVNTLRVAGELPYYSVYKSPESAAMRWREELSAEVVDRVMAIVHRSRFADCFSVDSIKRPVPS